MASVSIILLRNLRGEVLGKVSKFFEYRLSGGHLFRAEGATSGAITGVMNENMSTPMALKRPDCGSSLRELFRNN